MFSPTPSETAMIGRRISHYEVIAKIGAGGFGEVFRARDLKLQRDVAIKILPSDPSRAAEERARLVREARALAALNHPNIVTVYSVEEDDGVQFVTMELLEGESLEHALARGRLTQERFADLAMQLLEAMHAAHQQGVVHRDLKPANIMITANGRLKVLDFGIAKVLPGSVAAVFSNQEDSTRLVTQPGLVVGTIGYFSPEQAQGEPVDHRSDIFTLGVILYQLSTGSHPFPGQNIATIITSIMRDPPAPVRNAEPWALRLQPIIDRCLEKDSARRYQQVAEIINDLRAVLKQPAAFDTTEDPLQAGRDAAARHSWFEAFRHLQRADAQEGLPADDLERLSDAAWWTGRMDECCDLLKRAYAAFEKEPRRAALVSLKLADLYYHRARRAVSTGWLKRAERLLENAKESIEYGYLLRFKTVMALEIEGDTESALRLAHQSFDIGNRAEDKNLVALSTQDQGRALVDQGRLSEGMALLDEAMAAALTEELDPLIVAKTYCNMISACERTADYRRASEWTEEARNWSQPHGGSPFPGICSVHRAGILRLQGALQEAESEANQVCADSRGYIDVAGAAYYEVGEIKLRRGDYAGAEAAFREAHERGRDPVPGLPLLLLAQGKGDAARNLMARVMATPSLPLDRAKLLPAHVRISLAAGDLDAARTSVEELESITHKFDLAALKAAASQARGSLNIAESDFAGASLNLKRALDLWLEIDLPYEVAETRLLLSQAYRAIGDEASAELEFNAAQTSFVRLGAQETSPDVTKRTVKNQFESPPS